MSFIKILKNYFIDDVVEANISDEKSEQPSITPEKPIIKPKKIHLVCFKVTIYRIEK